MFAKQEPHPELSERQRLLEQGSPAGAGSGSPADGRDAFHQRHPVLTDTAGREIDRETAPTRDRILFAARHLFHQNGYHATGISAILGMAGVNSGSLYHYFPTKEDLLRELLEHYKEMLWPVVIQPVFDRVSDPIERIFGVLDGYRIMLTITKCSLGCPIGNLALELADTHPHIRRGCAENFDGWTRAIEQCLDDAADRLPGDVDRHALASFVLTTMEGGVMQAKTYRSLKPFESAVAQLRDYFDRLLAEGSGWK